MPKTSNASPIAGLIFLLIWIAGFAGWIWNIAKIIHTFNDPVTGLFIARCIGTIGFPLGAILGYV